MRKKVFLIFIFSLLLLCGCSKTSMLGIPKGYVKKDEFFDKNGFQDYTDYAKYIYLNEDEFIDNSEYRKVMLDDIEDIIGYFDNFKGFMEMLGRIDEYDFNDGIISIGDYVKIKTKEDQAIGDTKYGKYDDYSVYFFDVETYTLYYIHTNI